MPSISAVRKRSPHRRDAEEQHNTLNFELKTDDDRYGKMSKIHRSKNNAKAKFSDSEESVVSDEDLNAADTPHSFTTHQPQQIDPSMSTSVEPVELEGVQFHQTHTSTAHGQASATKHLHSAQNVSLQTSHGNNTEFNLRRLITPPSVEEMLGAVRDSRRTPRVGITNRPIARAESPHLHRIPRPPRDAVLARQQLVGGLYLILCMVIVPLSLVYGIGYLDGVMQHSTRGEITEMPRLQKIIALCWVTVVMAGCFVAIVWVVTK